MAAQPSNFTTTTTIVKDADDLQNEFAHTHRKFNRACDQMTLLDQRIKDMQVRYKRAMRNNKNAFKYTLRQRLAVITGIKMMFYEYASAQADKMDDLREQMESVMYLTSSDAESEEEEVDNVDQDSSLEIWRPQTGQLEYADECAYSRQASMPLSTPKSLFKGYPILQKEFNPTRW